MTLLKEYLKSQILKLEGTKVQEIQAKSNILVQYYFKISNAKNSCLNQKLLTLIPFRAPWLNSEHYKGTSNVFQNSFLKTYNTLQLVEESTSFTRYFALYERSCKNLYFQ